MRSPRRLRGAAALPLAASLALALALSCATRPKPEPAPPPAAAAGAAVAQPVSPNVPPAPAQAAPGPAPAPAEALVPAPAPVPPAAVPAPEPSRPTAPAPSAAAQPAPPQVPEEQPPLLALAPSAAERPAPPPAAPPRKPSYLEVSLSQYYSRTFPNGLVLSAKRQPGRVAAAARIALVPGAYPERLAGLPAIALACAAKGPMGAKPGSVDAALYAAGAVLELRVDDFDDVALELACPASIMPRMLDIVASSLIGPSFRAEDFDRVMGDFKLAERRESGDPGLRAAALLRSAAYRGHPYALPPRGSAASLAAIKRDDVLRFWAEGAGAERIRVSVVGDFDPAELGRELEPRLAAIPRRGPTPSAQPALPLRALVAAEPFPAYAGKAYLRAEFGAPPSSSPDFAALSVALAMLEDLVALRLRSSKPPLAYSAWTRLSAASAGSASLVIQGCSDPLAAKAAAEAAAASLASGSCLDATSSGAMGDIAGNLGPYLLRAVSRTYAKADGSADIAARIVRDLAAGGDGTGFFRLADRIAAVRAEDVVRVARERLVEGPAAWIALGDPKLVAGFGAQAAKGR